MEVLEAYLGHIFEKKNGKNLKIVVTVAGPGMSPK